jgi:hypothetical protein
MTTAIRFLPKVQIQLPALGDDDSPHGTALALNAANASNRLAGEDPSRLARGTF